MENALSDVNIISRELRKCRLYKSLYIEEVEPYIGSVITTRTIRYTAFEPKNLYFEVT